MRKIKPGYRLLVLCMRAATVSYLLLVLGIWLLLYMEGDRWWPATLVLFGPRWLLSLPLLVLVPIVAWLERRQLILLLVVAGIVFGPIMGFHVSLVRAKPQNPPIRVLTCNVGGPGLDIEKLRRFIQESGVDILALQECPRETAEKVLSGWNVVREESFIVASHYPIVSGKSRMSMHPPQHWPRLSLLQCLIRAPAGDLSFCSIHLPSPRYGLSRLLDRRRILNLSRLKHLNEDQEIRRKTSQEIEALLRPESLPMIIAGDFNMPVESIWYRQSWMNYSNAFSTAGFGYGWTEKIEVRGFEFKVRIDHILTRGELTAGKCRVGADVGSDHLPVIAEIYRTAQK